jgi:hypothetical protein
MWKEPVVRKIAKIQFEEARNPELDVAHYDHFVPGSKMIFWDIDEVMGNLQ